MTATVTENTTHLEPPLPTDQMVTTPSLVVLADYRTPFELEEITHWAGRTHPAAVVLASGSLSIDELPDSTVVAPARVVWLPPDRDGERLAAWADLVALTNPRRPRARAQRRIARRSPDRVVVVEGRPATIGNLRTRYAGSGDTSGFGRFVARQATLACERAELQVIGDRYKVPRLVAEQVTSSARFREKARALATELGRPEEEVLRDATDRLLEMVTVQSSLVLDLYTRVTRTFHERAWDVTADVDTLERLREANKSHALVFLPSHRTYLDPLVLADVLTSHDFPRNHTLGGDNMSFWPFGALGRRTGVIYIRRKFGSDKIYRLAAREYLSFLVEKRFNLEWYIEGGRSRTGKLRPPMLGLLAYLVDALEDHPDLDVMVVPTSIVYDQLAEIRTMAAEDSGGTKKPESLGWLARYVKAHRTSHGRARVRFAEPVSLREALAQAGVGGARLDKVAFQVMDGINRATPISATSLVGFALLGEGARAHTQSEIERILAPLLDYVDARTLPGPDRTLCQGDGLVRTLGLLTEKGVLQTYRGGEQQVWWVAPGNHSVAAYYRNGAIHHFVNRAITELTLLSLDNEEVAPDQRLRAGLMDALRLRDLLKYDFFFPPKRQFTDELVDEMRLIAPRWRELARTPVETSRVLRAEKVLFARRTLQSFIDAQLVVAEQLVDLGSEAYDETSFLARCLAMGRQTLLQGRISTPDSVSRELYGNALKLAANRRLLDSSDPEAAARREALLAEITDVRKRLAVIAGLEGTR